MIQPLVNVLPQGNLNTATPKLKGWKVMLMGASGTGKTHSIGTLVDAGLEVFVIMMENGLESLIGYWADRGLPVPANLHWCVIETPQEGFSILSDQSHKVATLQPDALAKMVDSKRGSNNYYRSMLQKMENFIDDRTGQAYGAVDSWDTSRVVAIDGLTGICDAVMYNVIGSKPMRSQQDWGLAQDLAYKFVTTLCNSCACHVVLIAHIEREADPVLGGVKIMASALGKALAPKLPSHFSDVILATRAAGKWVWDINNGQADIKARNLPWKADLPPDFRPLHQTWSRRTAAMSANTETK